MSAINNTFIHKNFTIVGYASLVGEHTDVDIPELVFPEPENLRDLAENLKADELVVALDDNRRMMPLKGLLDCKMPGFQVIDLVNFYEREQGIVSLEHTYPGWLIFCDGFAQGGLRAFEKRLFDWLASGLFLAATWPVMLLTALAIYVESGCNSPIFIGKSA